MDKDREAYSRPGKRVCRGTKPDCPETMGRGANWSLTSGLGSRAGKCKQRLYTFESVECPGF